MIVNPVKEVLPFYVFEIFDVVVSGENMYELQAQFKTRELAEIWIKEQPHKTFKIENREYM